MVLTGGDANKFTSTHDLTADLLDCVIADRRR
jgi:hypothetical protein